MATSTAAAAKPQRAPNHLGTKGKSLWHSIVTEYDLGPDDLRILEDACREADLIQRMDERIGEPTFRFEVKGSTNQTRTNPLIQEVRQHRTVLARLLGSLRLRELDGDTTGTPAAPASAREEAAVRWRLDA